MAEGGGLLNRYTAKSRIEGSNPSDSATHFAGNPRYINGIGIITGFQALQPRIVEFMNVELEPCSTGLSEALATGIVRQLEPIAAPGRVEKEPAIAAVLVGEDPAPCFRKCSMSSTGRSPEAFPGPSVFDGGLR